MAQETVSFLSCYLKPYFNIYYPKKIALIHELLVITGNRHIIVLLFLYRPETTGLRIIR